MAAADNNVKEATNVAPPPLSPKPAYFVQYPITNSTSSNNFPQSNSPAAFTFPPPLSPADNGSPETSALVESLPPPPPACKFADRVEDATPLLLESDPVTSFN